MAELRIPVRHEPTLLTEPVIQHGNQRLYQPEAFDDPHISPEDRACMQSTRLWMENFLMSAHVKKGKPRAICPFIQPAMENGLLYFSVLRLPMPNSLQGLYTAMVPFRDLLLQLPPQEGPLADLKSFIVLVPEASPTVMEGLMAIDSPHPLKTDWLEAGVMVGQFYPTCPFRAAWNWKVLLHQSPVPFFVVRPLIAQDWQFLHRQPLWQEIYFKRFGAVPSLVPLSWSQRMKALPLKWEQLSAQMLRKIALFS